MAFSCILAGRDYCHSRRSGYGWFQHLTSQILWPLTFHIYPCLISHIPYPIDLDQNIPNPTKVCAFCLCLITTLHPALSFPQYLLAVLSFLSTIFAGRIEFSSDGKGIDNLYVLIIYVFHDPRNICISPGREGGGGHAILPVTRPGTISIRRHPSGNKTVTSNIALAETMTNLIDVFIVAWDVNACSVLSAEQPAVSPIGHKPITEQQVYIPRNTAAPIPRGLVTHSWDQALNRVFSVISL